MVLKLGAFLSVILFIFTSCSTEVTEEKDVIVIPYGKDLYLQNCAACHGIDGALGLSGAKDLSQTKLKANEIFDLIENGKGAMPPFTGMLNDADIKAVVDHISTFKVE